jgi:hypothetical protein
MITKRFIHNNTSLNINLSNIIFLYLKKYPSYNIKYPSYNIKENTYTYYIKTNFKKMKKSGENTITVMKRLSKKWKINKL